jgi:hypothetical protein
MTLRAWAFLLIVGIYFLLTSNADATSVSAEPKTVTAPFSKSIVEGAVGIKSAHLIANDGGGNLNLQLVFKGEPNSQTRISLTTLFEPTRNELQGPK